MDIDFGEICGFRFQEIGGYRIRYLWSYLLGCQQLVNQEDGLWYRMGGEEEEIGECGYCGGELWGRKVFRVRNIGGFCLVFKGVLQMFVEEKQ